MHSAEASRAGACCGYGCSLYQQADSRPVPAVACTLHGTRRAFTAALHVALGDSTPLDVLRVDTAQGAKFASCIAGEAALPGS